MPSFATPGNSKVAVTIFRSLSSWRSILRYICVRKIIAKRNSRNLPWFERPHSAITVLILVSLDLTAWQEGLIEKAVKVVERFVIEDVRHVKRVFDSCSPSLAPFYTSLEESDW